MSVRGDLRKRHVNKDLKNGYKLVRQKEESIPNRENSLCKGPKTFKGQMQSIDQTNDCNEMRKT